MKKHSIPCKKNSWLFLLHFAKDHIKLIKVLISFLLIFFAKKSPPLFLLNVIFLTSSLNPLYSAPPRVKSLQFCCFFQANFCTISHVFLSVCTKSGHKKEKGRHSKEKSGLFNMMNISLNIKKKSHILFLAL